jgi:hypothetical protein
MMNTYARAMGRLVERPKKMLERAAIADVAMMRSRLTSVVQLVACSN